MLKKFVFVWIAVMACAQSAAAEDMTGAEIKQMLSGNSLYFELPDGSPTGAGVGVIYFSADGKATFKTPSGAVLDGTWATKENTNCIDWKQRPNNPCTRYERQGTTITLLHAVTGAPRGKVIKVENGNPEKL